VRGWLLTANCICGAEIAGIEQFEREPFCCVACRRELVMVHECYEGADCLDYTMPLSALLPEEVNSQLYPLALRPKRG
jgi:hypothetical protein